MTEMQVWLKQYTGVFWLKHNSFPGGASLFSVGAGGEVGGGWVGGWFLVKGRSLFSSGRRGKEEVPHGEYHFWWEWGFKEYPRVWGGTWKTMNVMFVSLDIVIFYAIQVWAKT